MRTDTRQLLSPIFSGLKKLLPRSRVGMVALMLAALWIFWSAGTVLFPGKIIRDYAQNPSWAGLLFGLFLLLPVMPVCYFLWRLYQRVKIGLLWKIRRRLILVYVFVGAIPIILIAGIFYVSAILVYYQFSYYLIFKQIGIHSARVHTFGLSLREGLQQLTLDTPQVSPEQLRKVVDSESRYILSAYPNASIILNCEQPATGEKISYVSQHSMSMPLADYPVPAWLQGREFSGLVLDDVHNNGDPPQLLLRSFVSENFPSDLAFSVEITVPFDSYIMARLKAALGQDVLRARQTRPFDISVVLPLTDIRREDILESTFNLDDATPWMWPIPLYPTSWNSGEEMSPTQMDTLMVEVSFPQLLRSLRSSDSEAVQWIFRALAVIVAIFILAEVASIVLGILLTRSVTTAVDNLDAGTQLIRQGDLNHRIIVRSQDQLGVLAASFNQMTEYVQQLVSERVQRERLEREIEIAREVQERLFPGGAPLINRLEITGMCLPARMVSGDYYDFLPLGGDDLGIAIGDISGKGISAALLMASLHATLHSNVMYLHDTLDEGGEKNVAGIVKLVNRQLCGYTGENRFATFFYAHYDDALSALVYCNAGHNSPLHFHRGEYRRLNVGGTVLGIFPEADYEQETIHLAKDDLLVAYTDGVSECTNRDGEEFGETRLIELVLANMNLSVEDLRERIIGNVMEWKSGEEQADDITLVIGRMAESD